MSLGNLIILAAKVAFVLGMAGALIILAGCARPDPGIKHNMLPGAVSVAYVDDPETGVRCYYRVFTSATLSCVTTEY